MATTDEDKVGEFEEVPGNLCEDCQLPWAECTCDDEDDIEDDIEDEDEDDIEDDIEDEDEET